MAFTPAPSWSNNTQAFTAAGATAGYQRAQAGANLPPQAQHPQGPANPAPAPSQPYAQPYAQPFPQTYAPSYPKAVPPPAQAAPAAAQAPAPVPSSEPRSSDTERKSDSQTISMKICKVNGRDKVIDFVSKLTKANLQDFANIHGVGGKDHARNSTIGLTICDYSHGTNDKSVTVKYSVDVAHMKILLHAATAARLNQLRPMSQQIDAPWFVYSREKNNPYKKGPNNFVPVSKVVVTYSPYRKDGAVSNYPWYIGIENFSAPLVEKKTGATSHNASAAKDKKSAFINLSADDFLAAMIKVDSFISLWEQRQMGPVMDEAYRAAEQMRDGRYAA